MYVLDILYNTFEEYNMTTDKQDKHGGFGAEVFERVKDIPTLDEKEIIRKPMERILTRLEECEKDCRQYKYMTDFQAQANAYLKAQEIIKEEGGIE